MNLFLKLESQDISSTGKWFRILLAPIWLILEYICYVKYWKRIIIPELITNDKIFEFLDKNEFEYTKDKLIKKDLIDEIESFNGKDLDTIKYEVQKEYTEHLINLISKNCSTNIEEYLSLIVNTDLEVIAVASEYYRVGIYKVIIQYCRLWWLNKARKYTFFWGLTLIIFAISIMLLTLY